jgi:hypothetical protein
MPPGVVLRSRGGSTTSTGAYVLELVGVRLLYQTRLVDSFINERRERELVPSIID